jgi:DNA polymerase type B, organellar and viral
MYPMYPMDTMNKKKKMNKQMEQKWNNYEIKLKNPSLISKDLLKVNINKFWSEIMKPLSDNHYVLFILRLKFDNNQLISASTLQKIDKTSKIEIIEYLYSRILVSNEAYSITPIKSIIFSYGIREGKLDPNVNELSLNSNINTKFQVYYKHKLPIVKSGKVNEYGKILSSNNEQYTIFVNSNAIIILDLTYINNQQINKIKYIKKGQVLYSWTDTITGLNKLVREIGKSVYYYENGELVLVKIEKKSKAIEKTKVNKKLDSKIITMDLETVLIDNVHTPYLLSWYDGITSKSYFINNLDPVTINYNILKMVNSAMDDICIKKYRNYRIYFHNFSKFDGYFLVKYLAKIGTCDPIIHKGKIISLKFSYNNYNITFKDSYLLLPSSLRKLCKSFKVKNAKGIFPYGLLDNIKVSMTI